MSRLLLLDPDDRLLQELERTLYNDETTSDIQLADSLEECLDKVASCDFSAIVINAVRATTDELTGLISRIASSRSGPDVVVVGKDFTKQDLLQLIEAGADGYVRGRGSAVEITQVLEMVRNRRFRLCPDMAGAVMSRIAQLAGYRLAPGGSSQEALTERQREVLELIREGMTNAQIAEKLYIEVGTVKNHVHNLLQKLEVDNRHEAAAKARLMVDDRLPLGA